MDHDHIDALSAFTGSSTYYEESTSTISLSEADLTVPQSPDSYRSSSVSDEKKSVKKRKSWGQELPTPKTNLPPRKRAKTEDEKEQRRIERVLRNRAAAQSSRERKRLEVEKLEDEKNTIEEQNYQLRQRLLQVEQEKYRLKQQVDKLAAALKETGASCEAILSSPPTPAMTPIDESIKQELDEDISLPQPINVDTHTSFSHKEPTLGSATDMTQHPAAMLCDLQCQSPAAVLRAARLPSTTSSTTTSSTPLMIRNHQQALATLHLCLMVHSAAYSTILTPLLTLLRSLKRGSPLKPNTLTPTTFTLIQWLISTPPQPPSSKMTTTPTSTTITTSSSNTLPTPTAPTSRTTSSTTSPPPSSTSTTFRNSLLRRLLSCNPALARPLKDATARTLRLKASATPREKSISTKTTEGLEDDLSKQVSPTSDSGVAKERTRAARVTDGWLGQESRLLFTMATSINQWERDQRRKKQQRQLQQQRQRSMKASNRIGRQRGRSSQRCVL